MRDLDGLKLLTFGAHDHESMKLLTQPLGGPHRTSILHLSLANHFMQPLKVQSQTSTTGKSIRLSCVLPGMTPLKCGATWIVTCCHHRGWASNRVRVDPYHAYPRVIVCNRSLFSVLE